MDPQIRLIRDKRQLEGTAYFEFLPGRYANKCWGKKSVFLDEEVLGLIEKPFMDCLPQYDHYAFCDVIASEWESILHRLHQFREQLVRAQTTEDVAGDFRCVLDSTKLSFAEDFSKNRTDLIHVIDEFEVWVRQTLKEHDTIAVLGM
jgi:hypothetical protein